MNTNKADTYIQKLDKAIKAIQSDVEYKNMGEFYQVLHARIGAFKISKKMFLEVLAND